MERRGRSASLERAGDRRYGGTGVGPTGTQWRIHYSLRLPSLECDAFEITAPQGGGTGEKLERLVEAAARLKGLACHQDSPPIAARAISAHEDVLQHFCQVRESKGLANETIDL